MKKKCCCCGNEKALTEFYSRSDRKTASGPASVWSKCKACIRLERKNPSSKQALWRLAHKEHLAIAAKERASLPESKYSEYKRQAKKRGISFDLSFGEFMMFWRKPCQYDGAPIATIGLDRLDSLGGYNLKNVGPCCSRCNYAKTDMNYGEFVDMCLRISKHVLGSGLVGKKHI